VLTKFQHNQLKLKGEGILMINLFFLIKTKNISIKEIIVNFLTFICGFLGLSALFFCLIQIFLRVFLKIAIPWVYELMYIFLVYSSFLGASVLLLKGKLIKVEFFTIKLPLKIKNIIFCIIQIVICFTGISIVYGGIIYRKTLRMYQMYNLPLTSEIFLYPVIIFGIILVCDSLNYFKEIQKEKEDIKRLQPKKYPYF